MKKSNNLITKETLLIKEKNKLKPLSQQQINKERIEQIRKEISEGIYHCDYEGKCKNKPYREVYPILMGGKHRGRGWNYLCRKHYFQEQKNYKGKLPSADVD